MEGEPLAVMKEAAIATRESCEQDRGGCRMATLQTAYKRVSPSLLGAESI